jgi:hypothetical protein
MVCFKVGKKKIMKKKVYNVEKYLNSLNKTFIFFCLIMFLNNQKKKIVGRSSS